MKNLKPCEILMTMTPGVNMITRQMTPFFHLIFKLYPLVYFIFCIKDLQNSVPWGPHFLALCSPLTCEIYIYSPKITHSSNLLTEASFVYIKFAQFWYTICFVSTLVLIWPRFQIMIVVENCLVLNLPPESYIIKVQCP